jgi:hypothetical protein
VLGSVPGPPPFCSAADVRRRALPLVGAWRCHSLTTRSSYCRRIYARWQTRLSMVLLPATRFRDHESWVCGGSTSLLAGSGPARPAHPLRVRLAPPRGLLALQLLPDVRQVVLRRHAIAWRLTRDGLGKGLLPASNVERQRRWRVTAPTQCTSSGVWRRLTTRSAGRRLSSLSGWARRDPPGQLPRRLCRTSDAAASLSRARSGESSQHQTPLSVEPLFASRFWAAYFTGGGAGLCARAAALLLSC